MNRLLQYFLDRRAALLSAADEQRQPQPPAAPVTGAAARAMEVEALAAAELALNDRDVMLADALLTPFADQSTDVGVLVRLSKIRMMQGNYDDAYRLLKKAEQHHPVDRWVWDTLAELLKSQRRYDEEIVYRRKLAYFETQPAVEAFTALVRTLISLATTGKKAPLKDAQVASTKVAEMAEGEPRSRLAFAEMLYRIDGMRGDALAHYHRASPCPDGETDLSARWMKLDQWAQQSGSPTHRIAEGGMPGLRPTVGEFRDVIVFPDFQWIPVLDEGRVALNGFLVMPLQMRSASPHAPILMDSPSHLELRVPDKLLTIDGPAVLLGGAPQYYHHTIDHASRLAHVEALNLGVGMPVVVNDDLLPFQLEHLALLGYPPERLIRVKAGQPVRFRELLVPTPQVRGGQWMDPLIPQWYRRRLVGDQGAGAPRRRLYLSRGKTLRRRILNEDDLQQMLVSSGYEVVQPEALSVREQIAMFAEASHIVSPSGAALTNMVYAPPGAHIVSMYSRYLHAGAKEFYFDALAEACGHHFSVVLGDVVDLRGIEQMGDANIVVDVDALRAALT